MRAFLIRLQKSSGNAVSEREERQKEELRKDVTGLLSWREASARRGG